MTTKLTWKAEDIVHALNGRCLHDQSWEAHGVSIDSRSLQTDDLFVALKGPYQDGHDHVAAAFSAGASAAVVAQQPLHVPAQAPLIFVEDTFNALQQLGEAGRKRSGARIIGVTGSVGKTGSKEMLRLMLSACGDTFATEGSLNNHWGVPLSLARLPQDVQYGVFELGMNHTGELTPLSQQTRPHVALITTIEAAHFEFFSSLEMIADAKAEIFSGMMGDGTAVLNRDNSQFHRLYAAAKSYGLKRILSFGHDNKADARLLSMIPSSSGSDVKVEVLGTKLHYHLSAPGAHVVTNSIGALLAAIAAGGDAEAAAAALTHYRAPQGRGAIMTLAIAGGDITLIDESYNASPAAVRAAISVLGQIKCPPGGRRILALGDMREMGSNSPKFHAELSHDIVSNKIDRVYCCGEMTNHLFEALPAEARGVHTDTSANLASFIVRDIRAGDVITIKGSKSMAMPVVVNALKALSTSPTAHKLAG